MRDFNDIFSGKIRVICFAILLLNGGLHINLANNSGLFVLWVVFAPLICEALAVGLFGTLILKLPIFISLAMGAILCNVGPTIVIPGLIKL